VTHDLLKQASKLWTDGIVDYTKQLAKAVTDRKKQLLYRSRFDNTSQTQHIHQRIKDVDFVSVKDFGYMTVETFETCYRPLIIRTVKQMDEKGYLVEGDADDLLRININDPKRGGIDVPFKFALRQCLEFTSFGNVLAIYTIGDHPEPAIAHLFKNIHSEVLALERAKTTDSLFVSRKYDI
jgi:hypothetical protein